MSLATSSLHNRQSPFIASLKGNIYPVSKLNTAKKTSCLLVNPNIVAKELIKKSVFNQKYTYNIWIN